MTSSSKGCARCNIKQTKCSLVGSETRKRGVKRSAANDEAPAPPLKRPRRRAPSPPAHSPSPAQRSPSSALTPLPDSVEDRLARLEEAQREILERQADGEFLLRRVGASVTALMQVFAEVNEIDVPEDFPVWSSTEDEDEDDEDD